jgi:DNA-binding LytR/AlgR family response regulator
MNCVIIDDDELARRTLEICIRRTDFLKLVGSFSRVSDAVAFMAKNKPELIFLDIEMPDINGIDFMRNFSTAGVQIVIVSSKTDYAIDAFDFDVTDYLVKPPVYARFLKAAMKAAGAYSTPAPASDGIFIKKDARLVKLNAKDILWVEALADYVIIHCDKNQRHTMAATMKLMEDKLPKSEFVRIHRSYIVRVDKIREIEDNTLIIGDKLLPISRGYKDNLYKRLNLI